MPGFDCDEIEQCGVGVVGTKSALTMALRDIVMEVRIFNSLKKVKRCLELQIVITNKSHINK